jgi:hypothetical protein
MRGQAEERNARIVKEKTPDRHPHFPQPGEGSR